jgi:hypothetical protein
MRLGTSTFVDRTDVHQSGLGSFIDLEESVEELLADLNPSKSLQWSHDFDTREDVQKLLKTAKALVHSSSKLTGTQSQSDRNGSDNGKA